MSFLNYNQPDQMACGDTCLRIERNGRKYAWNKMAEVTATSTLLLNDYRLPGLYQLPDLKYILE